MSLVDCVLDPVTLCITCPEIPFIPAVPPHLEFSTMAGWNAGADSLVTIEGDLHLVFSIVSATGAVVCGLKSVGDLYNWIPERIDFGLYFQEVAGLLFVSVVELGVTKLSDVEVDIGDAFEIRRVGGHVIYLAGTTVLYRSFALPSHSTMLANACLYISGDEIDSDPIFETYEGGGDSSGEGLATLPALQAFGYNGVMELGRSFLPKLTVYAPCDITRAAAVAVELQLKAYSSDHTNAAYVTLPSPQLVAHEEGIVPTVSVAVSTLPGLQVYAPCVITRIGNGLVTLPLLKSRAIQHNNIGIATLPLLRSYAPELPPQRYIAAIQNPGVTRIAVGGPQLPPLVISDSFFLSDLVDSLLTLGVFDGFSAQTGTGTNLAGMNSIADTVSAADFGAAIYQMVIASTLTVADDPSVAFNMLLDIADAVFATGAVGTNFVNALIYVALVAEIGDQADLSITLSVADTMAVLDADAIDRIGMMVEALESFLLTDTPALSLSFTAIVSDTLVFDDDPDGGNLTTLLDILDAGTFTGRLSLGGDMYSVYALTLPGQAPSEYVGTDFNSRATIRGRMYGASAAGISLLEGDKDDGVNIDASLRRGLSNLGTLLKKEVPNAYIGYTSDGGMVLEVTTTNRIGDGVKHVNRYKLNAIAKASTSNNRFSICKGLQAVNWDFRLKNFEGSDFELDIVKLWPLPLTRRK